MNCPFCQHEIQDDINYCPYCGNELKKCPNCHQIITISHARYCQHCGVELSNNTQTSHMGGFYEPISSRREKEDNVFYEEKRPQYLNKKVLIISIIVLIIATIGSYSYIRKEPLLNQLIKQEQPTSNKVTSSANYSSYIGNVNQEGIVTTDKQYVYICNEFGQLVQMNKDFTQQKVIVNDQCSYVYVKDDCLYYVDSSNYLQMMKKDGTKQETIIKDKVYYVVFKNNKIFYQLDSDNESIHVYDLSSKKDKKLNNRVSYNLNVLDECIYYTSNEGIYKIDLNSNVETKVMSGKYYNLIYQNNILYYLKNEDNKGVLESYDLTSSKKNEFDNKAYQFFNITDDYLFYLNQNAQVIRYDLKKNEEKIIYTGNTSSCYIIGDKLILSVTSTMFDKGKTHLIVMDFNGKNVQELFGQESGDFV